MCWGSQETIRYWRCGLGSIRDWVDAGLARGEARWRSRSSDLAPDKFLVPWGACELETLAHYSRYQVAAYRRRIGGPSADAIFGRLVNPGQSNYVADSKSAQPVYKSVYAYGR